MPRVTLTFALLLAACSADHAATPADSGPADVGATDSGPRIVFPDDEAPHREQMEWWYYTGRVKTAKGGTYGFELTMFQPRIANKFMYVSHFAITDLQKKSFAHDMQATAGDQHDAVPKGFKLQVPQVSMEGHGGNDKIKASMPGYALELSLKALKPVTLQYGTGWMYVGTDAPFYYYSYSRMAATGSITVDGAKQAVTGEAWMDHQWGTIGNGYGWDWFSLRLDDRSELMLFKVRRKDKAGFAGGTLIHPDGSTTPLGDKDFAVTNTGSWTSPHSKITYSHGWKIEVPSLKLSAAVDPLVQDQEFAKSFVGSPTYWEGLCDVTGTRAGKQLTGHAYVEITGYVPTL